MENRFAARRRALAQLLPEQGCALIFSGEEIPLGVDMTYPFSVDRNFYYLTGLDMPEAAVLIWAGGSRLYLPEPDPRREIYEGRQPSVQELCDTAGVAAESCALGATLEQLLQQLPVSGSLWLDLQRRSVPGFLPPNRRMEALARQAGRQCENVYPKVYSLRRVKDELEISKIRTAVDITGRSLQYMAHACRSGMKENEYQAAFEYAMRMEGSYPSFPSIVASGANSVYLHYVKNDAPVQRGGLLLMDVGAYHDHYAADISRTFPVGGFTQRQRELYQLVYDVTRVNLEYMQPYRRYQEHVDAMCAYFDRYLKPLRIADTEMERDRFLASLSRGVCHHLGLDAHDGYAGPDEILMPGMVFTNEPGVYLKEEGIGIRIEEDLLITPDGNELLSRNIPASAQDVEGLLN